MIAILSNDRDTNFLNGSLVVLILITIISLAKGINRRASCIQLEKWFYILRGTSYETIRYIRLYFIVFLSSQNESSAILYLFIASMNISLTKLSFCLLDNNYLTNEPTLENLSLILIVYYMIHPIP